jgi:EAL domain-containing protein (putative c-di-GMP-specific phosphodiesterase class I)
MAMHCSKANGRNTYQIYVPRMNEEMEKKLALVSDLRRALKNNEFFLNYQPILNLEERKIVSLEVLMRWHHPIRGLISPLQFIGIAEENGLIQSIGEWVLKTACLQNKAWQAMGLPPVKIAVNVSGIQFKQVDIVQIVQQALRNSSLNASYLELELTESSIMENKTVFLNSMNELSNIGINLVIDDFGTGYSSLAYLKQFPVSKIKIDKSFVNDISIDEDNRVIIQAIIVMAKQLRLDVVAEGVETYEQLKFLQDQQCTEIQGFFFAHPMSDQDCEKFMADYSHKLERFPPLGKLVK